MRKNKKNLQEELDRLRVLMEVSLINEQVQVFDDLAKIILRAADNIPDVKLKYSKIFSDLANAKNDEEAVKALAKLADVHPSFRNVIISKIMSTRKPEILKFVDDLIAHGKKLLQELDENGNPKNTPDSVKRTIESLVDNRIKTEFQGVKDIIKKDVIDAITKPVKVIDDTTPEGKLNALIEDWDLITARGLSAKDKILLTDKLWFRGLRAKINYILNNLYNTQIKRLGIEGGQSKSLEKILGLMKQIDSDKKLFETNPQIFATIDAEIEALRQTERFAKEEVYNVIRDAVESKLGRGRGYDFVEKLKANDKLNPNYPSYYKYLTDESALGKMLRFPGADETILKPSPWMIWWGNFVQRTLMFISSSTLYKINEIFNSYVRKHGAALGIFYFAATSKAIKSTLVPIFYALYDSLYHGVTTDEQGIGFWERFKLFLVERFKEFALGLERDIDQQAKNSLDDEQYNIWKALNPFTTFWDEIGAGLDWFEAGGFKRWADETERRNQEIIDREMRRLENIPDIERPDLPQVVVNPQQPNITQQQTGQPRGGTLPPGMTP